jgi:hypothetical protein
MTVVHWARHGENVANLSRTFSYREILQGVSDERRLDAVERLIRLAEEAGLPMPHLAMAFAISHPGVTNALLGARTMEQLDDLLAGADVVLSDDVVDRIDEIVPPGTDFGTLDQAYVPQRSGKRNCAAVRSTSAAPREARAVPVVIYTIRRRPTGGMPSPCGLDGSSETAKPSRPRNAELGPPVASSTRRARNTFRRREQTTCPPGCTLCKFAQTATF